MPQITAKDVETVRTWVTETPHHIGYREELKSGKSFLVLTDGKGGHRLRIPQDILQKADLVPGDVEGRHMFVPRGGSLPAAE